MGKLSLTNFHRPAKGIETQLDVDYEFSSWNATRRVFGKLCCQLALKLWLGNLVSLGLQKIWVIRLVVIPIWFPSYLPYSILTSRFGMLPPILVSSSSVQYPSFHCAIFGKQVHRSTIGKTIFMYVKVDTILGTSLVLFFIAQKFAVEGKSHCT